MKVLIAFTDNEDNNHVYNVGDEYPRENAQATDERIAYLLSDKNKFKRPVLEQEKQRKGVKKGG